MKILCNLHVAMHLTRICQRQIYHDNASVFNLSSFWWNIGLFSTLHTHLTLSCARLSCFLNWRSISRLRFEYVQNIKRNMTASLHCIQKWFVQWKTHWNKCVEYQRECILKKIKVLFIAHFCIGKYNFSINIFSTHLMNILPIFLKLNLGQDNCSITYTCSNRKSKIQIFIFQC